MLHHLLRQLYSLDTLDTRFVISATAPPKEALEESRVDPSKASHPQNGRYQWKSKVENAQPSKWNTPEFYFYYFIFLVVVPFMFKSVYDVSQESHPNYSEYARLLSDGWIPGRKVDDSDAQYSGFRQNVPYMLLVVLLHPVLRKAYDYLCRADTYTQVKPSTDRQNRLTHGLSASAAADARLEQRVSFDVIFAIIFATALHGFSVFKILLILFFNYSISRKLPKQYVPAVTWTCNIAVLFANELCRGYSYASLFSVFLPTPHVGEKDAPVKGWGELMDSYGGLIPRWEVFFNFTVLRLISFNMDYYWSLNSGNNSPVEKKQLDPSNLSERDRVSIPAKPADYSFRNYLAYTLYSPLFIAGPILTFNDYISQCRYRPHSIQGKRTLLYAIRFIITLLTMEIMIHYMYMVAIFKAKPKWDVYTPFQLSMLGYFNLKHIWLKLLLPWRFFRMWALLDGIDPPENMVRCMSDNYSVMAFWRGWHRSFNRWIIRYIYIPLGGSKSTGLKGQARAIANYLAVFTFVALWHDIQLRLLMWGWLITFFVVPEIVASMVFPRRKWRDHPNTYRVICGVGAVANILMLMVANLVGFALGLDGLDGLIKGIVKDYSGWAFFVSACAALFVGVQIMFEVREQEARRGIKMKC
ncbi:MBOAT-domain-containing protein [Delitschia confertaspora ATCC 74209]|uniref:MBOAT-domain-containing protein n=1 Tax=Delitschia confertaspora ATCC 74209 TaxID=1513339 RepID=A0A9P4MQJ7_9PLEO|nr:MBOAT-domain-containing protein [Delitschia confertaspora ATCC 74209]